MSRVLLREAIAPLPYRLREDVLSYATFVEEISPDRAAELDVRLSRDQRDQVVLLAGILYVRELVAGQLALAEAATGRGPSYAATTKVVGLRIGGEDLKRGSPYIRRLRELKRRLDELVRAANVPSSSRKLSDVILLVVQSDES